MYFKFNLGDRVKEKITGYKGVIVCQSRYMTGCNRYAIQNEKLEGGKPADWIYFADEDMLVPAGNNINVQIEQRGGPVRMEAPQR